MKPAAVSIASAAKKLGIGPKKLFAFLRAQNVLYSKGFYYNYPRQKFIAQGLFFIETTQYNTGNVTHNHGKPLVSTAGINYIRGLLNEVEKKRPVLHTKHQRLHSVQNVPLGHAQVRSNHTRYQNAQQIARHF